MPNPPKLARINAPLSDITRDFQAEREARKILRVQAVSDGAAQVPLLAAANAGSQVFRREMAQSAAAWRVMSCSDPALENPLLARMTEFWLNHLDVFAGPFPMPLNCQQFKKVRHNIFRWDGLGCGESQRNFFEKNSLRFLNQIG